MWGIISFKDLGPLHRIAERTTSEAYAGIIETVFLPYVLDRPFPDGLLWLQEDLHSQRNSATAS